MADGECAPHRRHGQLRADAKSRGGKVVTGGKRPSNQGFFYEHGRHRRADDSKIMTEEPFGGADRHLQTFDECGARELAALRLAPMLHHLELDRAAIGDASSQAWFGVNSVMI